jgi:hypothetical protein
MGLPLGVIIGHITQVVDRHRQPQHRTVRADAPGRGLLNLPVGPATNPGLRVWGDIGRNRGTPGAGKIEAARAGHAVVVTRSLAVQRRVAVQAMRHAAEIGTVGDAIGTGNRIVNLAMRFCQLSGQVAQRAGV